MAGGPVDLGTGASIAFATSAFSAELTAINGSGMSRASIDTTHLGNTPAMTFQPGDLVDYGEFEIEIHLNPNNQPPIDQPKETVTITFPLFAGDTTPATWAASAFMTNFDFTIPLEDKMVATATIKVDGIVTFVDST